jgi:hypothetical protein
MSATLDGVTVADHSINHRKVVVNHASTRHCLRRRKVGTIGKGGLPHPEPGAESRHIILVNKFVDFMGFVVVLCNEKGKIGPMKRGPARM